MAQFARPSEDILAWASGTYLNIDEVTPNDSDKVTSDTAPSADVAEYRLSTVEDPVVHTGHIIRYRYQKNAGGGSRIDLTVSLRQGSTDIAIWTHTDISNGWTTASQTLSTDEAADITDYADLRIRFSATQV